MVTCGGYDGERFAAGVPIQSVNVDLVGGTWL